MESERPKGQDIEFTDAELDMLADFSDAGLAGKEPDMEEYLKRCPGSEAKMRPILETDAMLRKEITEFRRKYPHVDLVKLLDLKHKSKPDPK
jgi:hypothetical protein